MQLVNTTELAAEAIVSDHGLTPEGHARRSLALVAKATFRLEGDRVRLETDAPRPILRDEEPTRLGLIPRDVIPPRADGLEVCLLGCAHAPHGGVTTEMTISLTVGDASRTLRVIGDRQWQRGPEGDLAVSPPASFSRMELTWSRAFGGRAEVYLDAKTSVPVEYQLNAEGRGFDPTESVRGLAERTGCAAGFPRVVLDRTLPNVESTDVPTYDPRAGVEPECWAPMPLQLGLRMKWAAEARGVRIDDEPPERSFPREPAPSGEGLWFAHPALRFPASMVGQQCTLRGCSPSGVLRFQIPAAAPEFDYEIGPRTGSGQLRPQLLTIFPEESVFTITYRHWARFVVEDESWARSTRLRFTDGG